MTGEIFWKIREKFSNRNLEPSSGLRGLMFSGRRNLIIDFGKESRFSTIVHMFFVFFPADIYWLDEQLNLVDYRKAKPFGIYIPKSKARYVVEISK